MQKKRFFFIISLLFPAHGSATAGYVTRYLKTNLAFSTEVFDAFADTKQYQIIRDFFYSLPKKITCEDDIQAVAWLKKKAWNDPSFAYIAARTLSARVVQTEKQVEQLSEVTFLTHLFLLYLQLCTIRCNSAELLQEHPTIHLFKKHTKCMNMFQFLPTEKKRLGLALKEWKERLESWHNLPDPSWIFCCRLTCPLINMCGYQSIVYDQYDKKFSTYFWQPKDEKERITIEVLCQKTYESWMKKYE